MRPQSAAQGDGYVWQIDVLRLVFAVMVVVGHAYVLVHELHPGWSPWPMSRLVTGGLWVSGFFVLSGYCIERAGGGRADRDVATYLVARLTRILPLYAVFLAVVGIGELGLAAVGGRPVMWEPHEINLIWQAGMLQGILDPYGAYNASWSLTHELLSYLAWGACLALVPARRRRLVAFALAFALLAPGVAAHAAIGTRASYTLVSLPLYFFFWLLGSLAATDVDRIRDGHGRRFGAAVLAIAGTVALWNLFQPRWGDTVWMVFWSLALAAALWLLPPRPGGVRPRPSPRLLAIARVAGLASYPIYLGHGIALIAAGTVVNHLDAAPPPEVLFPVYVAVAVGFAVIVGYPAEVRTLAWRAGVLRRRRAADAGE
ncbi:acyltransferase [Siculibacillus lacustris]|uniref:Acyltransferase n=1 Tax=Siculibacillus lacustris TaxID=1549641 RepID=A0A4Q9VXE1_9HYPH|nr:acyltransferase [Siculibacillus lacustris]TBW40951.1 acyltransferase [Siculibacillus lacustris]